MSTIVLHLFSKWTIFSSLYAKVYVLQYTTCIPDLIIESYVFDVFSFTERKLAPVLHKRNGKQR